MLRITGFHHVTAIARDPEQNVHFYTGVLGLRLVKVTVNFDDPGSYHLYYGSGRGNPGSILTFFLWAKSYPGIRSTGATSTIALAIPEGSIEFWKHCLLTERIQFEASAGSIDFVDPDGLALQLVEAAPLDPVLRWDEGPVDASRAIHGIHHIVLDIHAPDVAATQTLVQEQLGVADLVEINSVAAEKRGLMGPGIVHHVAWRAADDAEQAIWRHELTRSGLHVTPVQDREYFHSIYFREPGGVLYEIATDNPGFLIDETYAELGTNLKLPPWLEGRRAAIQSALPPLPQSESCTSKSCPV